MSEKLLDFIKYNNAFAIIIVSIFFSFGISYAASEDVRDSVYSSTEQVIAVDNSFIISADLDSFNFNLRISSVKEDEKNYYVVYTYQTLVIEGGVWQNKGTEKTLTVNKEALGAKDLGLFIAQELGENMNYELSYLKRVQQVERENGKSPKIVTVEYSGLIGKLLDPKEKVIEGYQPVIPEPVPEVPATVESNPEQVIVSTPHPEPVTQDELPTSPPSEIQPIPEATSTSPESESFTEPVPEILESETAPSSNPAPEGLVDQKLIQEVIGEFLQDEATSTQ
jgi:hypothetical protein